MFTLMTYLAINIPGDPDVIQCFAIENTVALNIKSCIVQYDSEIFRPKAKVTISCQGASRPKTGKWSWTLYPKEDLLSDTDYNLYVCKVVEYKSF